jgi:hypothetical protein
MRTRLQRIRDAKFFTGWVTEFDEHEVKVRLSTLDTFEPGDHYLLEVFGPEVDAILQARVRMAFDNQAYFTVHGAVNYRPATENARIRVTGISGVLIFSDFEAEGKVVDISQNGIGMLVRKPLPQKSQMRIRLLTPKGEINAEGEVRYCRAETNGSGSYRIGIRLGLLGRLERARWHRLFETDVAA